MYYLHLLAHLLKPHRKTSQEASNQTAQQTEQNSTQEVIKSADGSYETAIIKSDIPSPMKEMRTKMGDNSITVKLWKSVG